jgi:hypothetical protein
VAKAFAMVQQQERKNPILDISDGKNFPIVAATWKGNNQNKGKSKTNPCKHIRKICSFCGKENQSVET